MVFCHTFTRYVVIIHPLHFFFNSVASESHSPLNGLLRTERFIQTFYLRGLKTFMSLIIYLFIFYSLRLFSYNDNCFYKSSIFTLPYALLYIQICIAMKQYTNIYDPLSKKSTTLFILSILHFLFAGLCLTGSNPLRLPLPKVYK